ncbi:erythromycin esterase family protein [Pedobacter nyackensis]|uniref:Erythromycin esterase n=1 Tax=Pedobacter nyackensis TaxID=475255 RepID=A0A1W2C9N7_9SPHI|nr:erythromycin esterase family protein [Pedobacter nyackensis]SMC81592.1 Erythromycin esterase [Pedobacter nyackensis]
MTRILIICLLIAFFTTEGHSQHLKWINENAYPIHNTSSKNKDLSFLSNELKGNIILGLGEASHGTCEFFLQKNQIIQYLITNLNYKLIGFESTGSRMELINQYLHNGNGDLKAFMKDLGLYNSIEIYDMLTWIRNYNKTTSPSDRVTLFGFDNEDFWPDPFTRDKLMSDKIIETQKTMGTKTILWSHNVHIAKDTTMAQLKAMGAYLKQELDQKFYAIGFDTYQGSVNIIKDGEFEKHDFLAQENTFSSMFAKAKNERFFLPFNKKPNPFMGIKSHITNIFSNWTETRSLPIKPGFDFDGLIFIRETSASVQLK